MWNWITCMALFAVQDAQTEQSTGFAGTASSSRPTVEIPWNRLYDYTEIYAHLDRLAAQWPELLTHEVIGHSVENREMRVYTLTNPSTGPGDSKPAMWVDANVHGNEMQGGPRRSSTWPGICSRTTARTRVSPSWSIGPTFYFLPMVNPDGRAYWFREANTASSSRSGVQAPRQRWGRAPGRGPARRSRRRREHHADAQVRAPSVKELTG